MKTAFLILLMIASTWAVAHPGIGIVMDSKGNVYYTDLTQVLKIDLRGNKSVVVKNVHTHELYIDSNDNVFGEHLWYGGEKTDDWWYYVWRLTPNGSLEKIVPPTKGFRSQHSFVKDVHDNSYWVDDTKHGCLRLRKNSHNQSVVKPVDSCFNMIHWLHVSRAGNLYFTNGNHLVRVDQTGHVKPLAKVVNTHATAQKNNDQYISGLSTDAAENVYVADYTARVVRKVDRYGNVSVFQTTRTPWSPAGTLMGRNGDFWLLECSSTNEVRVEKISKDGTRTIY